MENDGDCMKYTDERIHSYELRFFENNKKIWKKEDCISSTKYVLVIHSLIVEINFCSLENIAAKKIAFSTNSSILSVQYRGVQKKHRTVG